MPRSPHQGSSSPRPPRTTWGARAPPPVRPQAPARGLPEFGEHLAEMPLEGARAEKELGPDLGVAPALCCEARDECLLRCQLVRRVDRTGAHGLSGRRQLMPRAFREPFHA